MATEGGGEEKTQRARVIYDFEGDGEENQVYNYINTKY